MNEYFKALLVPFFVLFAPFVQGCGDNNGDGNSEDDAFGGTWKLGIFSSEMDGSSVRSLWKGDELISFIEISPGGDNIAMVLFTGEDESGLDYTNTAIATMDLSSPNPSVDVLFDAEGVDMLPSWSPDGDKIVFVSQCAGEGNGSMCITGSASERLRGGGGVRSDIFILDVGTGEVENLTNTPDATEGDPSWGAQEVILFIRVNTDQSDPNYSNTQVWAHNLTNGNEKLITEPATPPFEEEGLWGPGDFDPHMSPEGTKIAFERHMDNSWSIEGNVIGDFDIFILDLAQGNALHTIDDTDDADIRPVWAPGGWISFWRGYKNASGNPFDVLVMKDDGSSKMNITAGLPILGAQWPHWIPRESEPKVDGTPDLVFLAISENQ